MLPPLPRHVLISLRCRHATPYDYAADYFRAAADAADASMLLLIREARHARMMMRWR